MGTVLPFLALLLTALSGVAACSVERPAEVVWLMGFLPGLLAAAVAAVCLMERAGR